MKYRVIDISSSISLKSLTHRMSFPQLLAAKTVTIQLYKLRHTNDQSDSFPVAPQPICLFLCERKEKWRSQLPEDEGAEFLTK